MSFLQFYAWGGWLITVGNYWFATKGWSSADLGLVFSTMGLSSLVMPALMGMVADRWMNAERLYGILHFLGAATLACVPLAQTSTAFFWCIFLAMLFYMPTIALANSISYTILKRQGLDVVQAFPPIRVWGTVGFIVAMWVVNLTGNKASEMQFWIAAGVEAVLGFYAFALPACPPPSRGSSEKRSWAQVFGFDAFKLLRQRHMALFFLFALLLGAALQLTNMFGDAFLNDFRLMPEFAGSWVVRYSTIVMSISQISETLFILAIPFFLGRFGIKKVMLMSMLAWVLRFGLFAWGDPSMGRMWMIVLSCVVYGMAFDFFNISGSLYTETSVDKRIRSSAQGLFMMASNGLGAVIGSVVSGWAIQSFFTAADGTKEWRAIWLVFALYALVVGALFALLFKNPKKATA